MDMSIRTLLKDSNEKIDIENHFSIVAGPGAGKTTFLVNHIKNIVKISSKISATRKIACITYTNVGVDSIISKLGNSYESTEVSTIHSFLYQNVVKPYLWVLSDDYEFDLANINGHDEILATHSILKEWRTETNQNNFSEDKLLATELSKLTWILEGSEIKLKFRKVGQGKIGNYNIKKNSYMVYKKICWRLGLLSHDDILYLGYKIVIKQPRVLEILRAKFPYIIIDEFQDTNPIQSEIIKLIAKEDSVIGVIGDDCQSIYKFQGADVEQFKSFELLNMRYYYIEDNRRSTSQIIDLLNYLRDQKHFVQKSPENLQGEKPYIIVGNLFKAFDKIKDDCKDNEIYSLSYRQEVSGQLKYDIDSLITKQISNDIIFDDSERGKMIYYTICSIEYAKQHNYKDCIKYMKKAYRKVKGFEDKDAIQNLKRLLDNYSDISTSSILKYYNDYIYGNYDVKGKISRGAKMDYYENLTYKQVASIVTINKDDGKFRTIHSVKGDEFDNVLLVINHNDFNEEKDLEFLLNPNMEKESHRVHYVALSRAKKRLYISIPTISKKARKKLEDLSFLNIENR